MTSADLCSDTTMCEIMKASAQYSDLKGIVKVHYLNTKTFEESGYIIGYRPKAGIKTKWFGFQVCPFCAQPINQWQLMR